MAGGTVARPYVNLSKDFGNELAYGGYLALKNGNPKRAISLYEKAVIVDPHDSDCWHNLGIAYDQVGRTDDAKRAFRTRKCWCTDR